MKNDIDKEFFKEKLTEELSSIEKALEEIGRRNPDNKADWEAEPADFDIDTADDSERADKMEEFEENTAILKDLEERYNDVKDALNKIENGTYGFCEVCGNQIEEDRLIANQAARTCKAHMN